jgi:hypothetical protein
VGAVSSDFIVAFTTPWQLVFGAGTNGLRLMDEMQAKEGNHQQKVCWRTAEVLTDFPDAWSYSSNVHTTNGAVNVEDFTPTAGKMWVQGGLSVAASSGSGQALASLLAGVAGEGRIVATGTIDVQPDVNSGQAAYHLIGEEFPAQGMSNLMFAAVIKGVDGTLGWQPAVRYLNRPDAPGNWSDLWSAQSPTASTRTNSGSLGISPGTNMFAQVGIKITSTAARGSFALIVAGY